MSSGIHQFNTDNIFEIKQSEICFGKITLRDVGLKVCFSVDDCNLLSLIGLGSSKR